MENMHVDYDNDKCFPAEYIERAGWGHEIRGIYAKRRDTEDWLHHEKASTCMGNGFRLQLMESTVSLLTERVRNHELIKHSDVVSMG